MTTHTTPSEGTDKGPRHTAVAEAIDTGRIDRNGIRAVNSPPSYRGVWIGVIRDQTGAPVAAFDGNGKVVFLADGVYLTEHDSRRHPMRVVDVEAVLFQ